MGFIVVLAACGGDPETPTPTSTATAIALPGTPTPGPSPTATATPTNPTPTPTRTRVPTSPPTPTATPMPLVLELLSPQDGLGVEIGAVRVLGKTRVDAVVGINGTPVEVSADGTFQHDVVLDEGATSIEVVAIDLSGDTAFEQVVVFSISTTSGLPFSIFYPPDGIEVSEPTIQVIGGTRLDATIGVNGTPTEPNALGIFSTLVSLEEGGNIIEVVAADIQGNVRFQNLVVFYLP
ncbi:MAG: hypothetical protein IIC27_04130 [Chloroflexi bacterium]|nr:hypothetical protein [Chloroflexota bacterium]